MADHLRKQIRDAIKTRLTGLMTTGSDVFVNHLYPMDVADLPALNIITDDAQQIQNVTFGYPRSQLNTMPVKVVVHVKKVSGYDDEIDQIILEVQKAMTTDITFGGIAKDCKCKGIDLNFDGDGDQPAVSGTVLWELEYHTLETTPDVSD